VRPSKGWRSRRIFVVPEKLRRWVVCDEFFRLAKIIVSANVEAVTIPSTAGRQERDRLLRDFVKKAERVQHGEVVLGIVRS